MHKWKIYCKDQPLGRLLDTKKLENYSCMKTIKLILYTEVSGSQYFGLHWSNFGFKPRLCKWLWKFTEAKYFCIILLPLWFVLGAAGNGNYYPVCSNTVKYVVCIVQCVLCCVVCIVYYSLCRVHCCTVRSV